MESNDFLAALAGQLVHELLPNDAIKQFTRNPDLLGKYTEVSVRRLIRRVVSPLRVSTGAVIDAGPAGVTPDVPQIDTIVWLPCPVPALFETDDFGLVPRGSSMGFLEVKRSSYTGVGRSLRERLDDGWVKRYVADPGREHDGEAWLRLPAMGVVCIRETNQHDGDLDDLVENKRAVVLFDRHGEALRARPKDICELVNFLRYLRWRGKAHDGEWSLVYTGD